MRRRLRFRDRVRAFAGHGLRPLFASAAVLCVLVAAMLAGLLAARAIVESVRGVWGAVAFSFGVLGAIFALIAYLAGNLPGGVFLCSSGTGGTSPTSPTSSPTSSTGRGNTGTSGGNTGTRFCGTGPSGGTCPFACCCESGTCGRGCPPGGPTQEGGC
jgi:hypothetical protein